MRCLVLSMVVLSVTACGTPEWVSRERARMKAALNTVQPLDGIDVAEAKTIAGVYLSEYVTPDCARPERRNEPKMSGDICTTGRLTEPVLEDGVWSTTLRYGCFGHPGPTVHIDPRHGAVWSSPRTGPHFVNFDWFRRGTHEHFTERHHLH